MDTNSPSEIFPCSDLDRRERVWYFADYAAGACLPLLEGFMRHARIPDGLRAACEEAVFAHRHILDRNEQDDRPTDAETASRVLYGLHHFAVCLPFLNAEYMFVDDEAYAQTNRQMARRILPALRAFADHTQFPPAYFSRIYMDLEDECAHWDAALNEMIFAFECLEDPARHHNEPSLKRMRTGLHLFAEYWQEMYNL